MRKKNMVWHLPGSRRNPKPFQAHSMDLEECNSAQGDTVSLQSLQQGRKEDPLNNIGFISK